MGTFSLVEICANSAIDLNLESMKHKLIATVCIKTAEKCGWSSGSCDKFTIGVFYDEIVTSKNIVKGLYINLQITSDENVSESVVYVSKFFLQHYNLEPNGKYWLTICLQPVNLDRVVFGALSEQAFKWVQTPNWQIQMASVIEKRPVLCRKGDMVVFQAIEMPEIEMDISSNFITVDCSPVSQGILSKHTNIIITRLSVKHEKRRYKEKGITDKEHGEICVHSVDNYLTLMEYTSRLAFRSASLPRHFLKKSLEFSGAGLNMFRPYILPKFSFVFHPRRIDVHNSIFLPKQMLTNLKVADWEWVHIKLIEGSDGTHKMKSRRVRRSSSVRESGMRSLPVEGSLKLTQSYSLDLDDAKSLEETFENWRLARVFSSQDLIDSKTMQMTPQLWFNLNSHPSCLLQPGANIFLRTAGKINLSPPFAKELFLALVHSPSYSQSHNYDSIIKKYFSVPRYVCEGDIISLSTRNDCLFQAKLEDTTSLSWPVLFFRVTKLEGPPKYNHVGGYLVDSRCTLYQLGTLQHYIPITMETFLSPSPLSSLWDGPLPNGLSTTVEKLCDLVKPFIWERNVRDSVSASILLTGPIGCGKSVVVSAVSRSFNLHLYTINCQELIGETPGVSEAKLRNISNKALINAPCILFLRDASALLKDSELSKEDPRTEALLCYILTKLPLNRDLPIVVIATANSPSCLNPDLLTLFIHCLEMESPTELEKTSMLDSIIGSAVERSADMSLEWLAQKTPGLQLGDLNAVINDATQNAYDRVKLFKEENKLSDEALCLAGLPLYQKDVVASIDKLLSSQAQAVGAPNIPKVQWDDVGGLETVKREIMETIQLPLDHPELLQSGLRRSGLLLHGPPGTGKTLLAKAVATECSLSFLSVKGPELINMYVGQSEQNIREVFAKARQASPCIIFFDELDSLAPNRGASGDSGGVMDRVVSQLLAELDGLHKSVNVFVIGATNRPDLLDPALLRPGRFDRLIYVGLPEKSEERMKIIAALTRKMPLSEDVDINEIEKMAPMGLSGADIYAFCSEAQASALGRCILAIEAQTKSGADVDSSLFEPIVTMDDFEFALNTIAPPSPSGKVLKNV